MTASTTTDPSRVVEAPGIYDLTDTTYHADPVKEGSLSFSGAKKLLPPYCPAIFKWERQNGRADKPAFDLGHAAHTLALGAGAAVVEVEADSWRTNAAKAAAEQIRADGGVPLLTDAYRTVHAMADALAAHPLALALLSEGTPEASAFWRDTETGSWLRCRYDWLPNRSVGRSIIVDFKSAASANPEKFARSAADYGYHQQAAWYLDGVTALNLADDAAFVFIVQEKTPPYLVTVCELDPQALRIGRALNREAIDLYARCVTDDDWPGYSNDVELVSLPYYYARNFEDSL